MLCACVVSGGAAQREGRCPIGGMRWFSCPLEDTQGLVLGLEGKWGLPELEHHWNLEITKKRSFFPVAMCYPGVLWILFAGIHFHGRLNLSLPSGVQIPRTSAGNPPVSLKSASHHLNLPHVCPSCCKQALLTPSDAHPLSLISVSICLSLTFGKFIVKLIQMQTSTH